MLNTAVGITIGGGFVIGTPNTPSTASIFFVLSTARALSFVGLLLVLSVLILLFAAVETIPPVIT